MQVERVVLYGPKGTAPREIVFKLGSLNVITGASKTGKSSLLGIIRYCLGDKSPSVPAGPIADTVSWFGLMLRLGERRLFAARPSSSGAGEVSAAMLLVEPDGVPLQEELVPNTTRVGLREFLARTLGIEENDVITSIGRGRAAAAGFVHSLYYCFQGQGEVADPDLLFHRQGLEWQSQTIRDTLPYFVGAQGFDEMRNRRVLADRRRALNNAQRQLDNAESELAFADERAEALVQEARDAHLLGVDESGLKLPPVDEATDGERDAVSMLTDLLTKPLAGAASDDLGASFNDAEEEKAELRQRIRQIGDRLRGVEDFSRISSEYEHELGEHRNRLHAIGLIPEASNAFECPICGTACESGGLSGAVLDELSVVQRRLEIANRDTPRIEQARDDLLEERDGVLRRIRQLDATLESLATTQEAVERDRRRLNLQSYVLGKIAQFLDQLENIEDATITELRHRAESLRVEVLRLEESLDPETIRSRLNSSVARVSQSLTEIARDLGLEHSEHGVRLDPYALTVVADTPSGPASMKDGEIGSGFNWVGYHIATYLALQHFFINENRPVPQFLLFDQPSQAFFPSDVVTEGQVDDVPDEDREQTLQLFRKLYDSVAALEGRLQVIVLDHADFEDKWFGEAVIERWRGGNALIPSAWLQANEAAGE